MLADSYLILISNDLDYGNTVLRFNISQLLILYSDQIYIFEMVKFIVNALGESTFNQNQNVKNYIDRN